jgi:hypothetical protein
MGGGGESQENQRKRIKEFLANFDQAMDRMISVN